MATASEFWTTDNVSRLKVLWPQREISTSVIAGILGCSKNAVISKAHRSNFEPRVEPRIIDRLPHPLDGIGTQDCRWPIGRPGEDGFHFCRALVEVAGRPYCETHHRRSVTRVVKAEDLA